MLGIKFIKFQPSTYVLQYRNGNVVREGAGLSFYYFAPTTELVAVPIASEEAPFIFEEKSADFQQITIQGQVTFRITNATKMATLLNYSINPVTQQYVSEDPKKLSQRVINVIKVLIRKDLQKLSLKDSLKAADALIHLLTTAVQQSSELNALGIEVLGLSVLAIKPSPETARALEAEAREQILKEADEAVYARRNSAVEQERRIKENELNTEIAVETKKRQIREAQMDAERSIQEKRQELQQSNMKADISLESEKKKLVALVTENAKCEADTKAYAISEIMKAYAGVDPKTIQALSASGMSPSQLIAMAFQDIADKAGNIGQLNITPDLLREIMSNAPAPARK
jgi:regulator of protease activity HflC (stomatin/prohibitin superfamily)